MLTSITNIALLAESLDYYQENQSLGALPSREEAMIVGFQCIYTMPMTIFSVRDLEIHINLVPPQTPLAELLNEFAVLREEENLLIGSPGQRLGCANRHDYKELSSWYEPLTRLY